MAQVGAFPLFGVPSSGGIPTEVGTPNAPTTLLDIVEIGKQMLITRGSLTTFSIANDVAKYFAIIPFIGIKVIDGIITTLQLV